MCLPIGRQPVYGRHELDRRQSGTYEPGIEMQREKVQVNVIMRPRVSGLEPGAEGVNLRPARAEIRHACLKELGRCAGVRLYGSAVG